ncbi:MAG: DUF134 domain-containing protein [Oscillospiraceae bacterium]|nr:DUF134 domain-containing protein [Oscillospiraceae bacterium]
MARPQRCRRVCREPEYLRFCPEEGTDSGQVQLNIDEYEVLRLVDYEHLTHAQCAAQMDISRTTVTEIYESARSKLADCVVNGKRLVIEGGNYRLCDGSASELCGCDCGRASEEARKNTIILKGSNTMRIAVTYDENGDIFQHFGHTEKFKFYDIVDKRVVYSQVVDTNGSGHGALADFLAGNKVDTLICGGIGGGAQVALMEAGVLLYGGCRGKADDAVAALLDGTLLYNPAVRCDHHDHHGEGHSCGSHGCGHSCH